MKVSLRDRKYFLLAALLLLQLPLWVFAQSSILVGSHNKNSKPFQKIDEPFQFNKQAGLTNFYPLNDSNYVEYVQNDTTVLRTSAGDYPGLPFSVFSEVLGDTVMSNGLIYKKIRWSKCANSVNKSPDFEYLRKDTSGNVYVFYNNVDNQLYDFSKDTGKVYASQYAGYKWKVLNKYTVTGFGSQHNAIDFGLLDSTGAIKRKVSIIQNFGLASYKGDINISPDLPNGNFFGAIINDSTYGYLLAKRQKIDWGDFYPLHIGDFWKYKGKDGQFETTRYVWAVKDTLMPDNNIYTMLYSQSYGGPYAGKDTSFERLDSTGGRVFVWHSYDSTAALKHKFSSCLGDTFTTFSPSDFFNRYDDKSYAEIYYFFYPDLTNSGTYFSRGLGFSYQSGEFVYEGLVGAVIDGKIYGDTTISGIEKSASNIPTGFKLYQNYPNPFNPTTIIKYSIPEYSHISLKVYDLLGREIITLVNEEKPAGEYQVKFNAKDLASGIYFYTINSNDFFDRKKMIVLK